MSFGAFGGRADIMDLFDPRRPDALPHAGTFNNNVLTMSAGLVGLTEVYTPEAANALNARGDALRERLNALCRTHDAPVQFTGIGSMLAVHFTRGAVRSPADAAKGDQKLKELFFFDMLAQGIWHIVKKYAASLGVPKLAPHDLRRSCARFCHTAGGELEQIQFLLGHVSVQTTELLRVQATPLGCGQRPDRY